MEISFASFGIMLILVRVPPLRISSMNPLRVSLRCTRVPLLLRSASQKGEDQAPAPFVGRKGRERNERGMSGENGRLCLI